LILRVGCFVEGYIAGGADVVLVNLINNWGRTGDEFVLLCNHSHDGLDLIFRRRIIRKTQIVSMDVLTYPDIVSILRRRGRWIELLGKAVLFYGRYALWIYQIWAVKRLLGGLDLDMLIINNGGYPGGETCRAAVVSARLAGIRKVVMIVHNFAVSPRRLLGPMEYMIDRCVNRYATLVAVSRAVVNSLVQERSIAQQPVVIWNGIPKPPELHLSRSEVCAEFGLPPSSKMIAMIASLEPRKGHHVLIAAIPFVLREIPEARFLIFGKGSTDQEERIRGLLAEHEVESAVVLAGFRSNVQAYLPAQDLLVLPSCEYESFGLVLLEAMACKIPVVATDHGGIPEVIENGVTGYLVPPLSHDALSRAIIRVLKDADAELGKLLGRSGYERYKKHFTAEEMARQYENLLVSDQI